MRAGTLLAFAPLLVACRGATEITVEVSTDLNCGDHAGTTITVGKLGELSKPPTTTSFQCGANKSLGTLVIVPSAGNDEQVAFEVTTGININPELCNDPKNAAQCIVARRALRFIPHESLRVKVPMRVDCRGIQCLSNLTCVHGSCVPAAIDDSSRCGGAGCGEDGLVPPSDVLPGKVATLSLGIEHSCALMKDHSVWCWGANDKGQTGIGQNGGVVPAPSKVPNLGVAVGLSAFSEGHTCALMDDGTVSCWGDACCGQLGDPSFNVTQYTPVKVPSLGGVGAVAVGRAHTCALGVGGTSLSCWGIYHGLPGEGSPVAIPIANGVVDTFGSGDNLVVLKMKDGTVRVVGANRFGQLGLGNPDIDASTGATVAATVPGISGVTSVANGNSFVVATLPDGGVVAWGESSSQQLGLDDFNDHPGPTLSPNLSGLHAFALGDQHGCALDPGGKVKCWGSGSFQELGPASQGTFVPVEVGITAARVFAGWHHSCAVELSGDVVCWGSNNKGQLGDGTTADQPTPKKVLGLP